MNENAILSNHPLIADKITQMRNEEISIIAFNRLMKEIGMLMAYEISTYFTYKSFDFTTPRGNSTGKILNNNIALVPILRSGLVFSEGIQQVINPITIGHIGIHQDKNTHKITEYFVSLPDVDGKIFVLVDPVIATGLTSCRSVEILQENGVNESDILFVCLVSSLSGQERFTKMYPKARLLCAAIDSGIDEISKKQKGLNISMQVVPGLGAISNRLFGFKTALSNNY